MVDLINCREINHHQKSTFIIWKQLNGRILKSLKPKWAVPKSEKKNWPGWARAKIVYFLGSSWTRVEISIPLSGWSGPIRDYSHGSLVGTGPKKSGSCRPLFSERSISRKYSSDVLKIIYVAWTILKILQIRLTIYQETQKKFPTYYGLWEEIFKAYFNIFIVH